MTDLTWGYKLVGTDLCTDDKQGGRFRYRLGEWHDADPGARSFTTAKDCPQFPGDGLCVARTLRGACSGGARVGASVMLLVGYHPNDVLNDSGSKIRVKRLYVHPDPQDPVRLLTGRGSNLSYSNLSCSDLRGSNLSYSDLSGSNLSYSNLRGSNLSYSDLSGSDLSGSNLSYSDLRGSNLSGSDLSGSNLSGSRGNASTVLPAGWVVNESGLIVRKP